MDSKDLIYNLYWDNTIRKEIKMNIFLENKTVFGIIHNYVTEYR